MVGLDLHSTTPCADTDQWAGMSRHETDALGHRLRVSPPCASKERPGTTYLNADLSSARSALHNMQPRERSRPGLGVSPNDPPLVLNSVPIVTGKEHTIMHRNFQSELCGPGTELSQHSSQNNQAALQEWTKRDNTQRANPLAHAERLQSISTIQGSSCRDVKGACGQRLNPPIPFDLSSCDPQQRLRPEQVELAGTVGKEQDPTPLEVDVLDF